MTITEIHDTEHFDGSQGLLAVVLSDSLHVPEYGTVFYTHPSHGLQVGRHRHFSGKTIAPHRHPEAQRTVRTTQEVLIVRQGRVKVDFYSDAGCFVRSHTIVAGDVLILLQGGHGFTMLDEAEMIEVRNGPYLGLMDKVSIPTAISAGGAA